MSGPDTTYVEDTLQLLKGMQQLFLVASDVEVREDGVKLTGVTTYIPPHLSALEATTSEMEGRGA
jgi:hypothetical protein